MVENVRMGRYQIGMTTAVPATRDLIHYPVIAEPMAIVNSAEGAKAKPGAPLITIEPTSITWRAIEPLLREHHPALLLRDRVVVESFSAALQMVKAG